MKRLRRPRLALVAGALLFAAGLGVLGTGLYVRWHGVQEATARSHKESDALSAWNHAGNSAVAGAPSATASAAPAPTVAAAAASQGCGGSGAMTDAYALVRFSRVGESDYAGVSVDGNWDKLHDRSMVHWHGSPDPGGQGNLILAFHREPDYRNIDQLAPGATITIQDRTCHVYVYTVATRWDLAPERVTQLVPTGGRDLTLVTCTPWWQDYRRLVWRASLTAVDGKPV